MSSAYGSDMYASHRQSVTVEIEENTHVYSKLRTWEFPGWGKQTHINVPGPEIEAIRDQQLRPHTKLSEWPATAICGNDILSSCLYVSGLVASKAGKLAPVSLAIVAGVLYLYRFIYGEVVSAIPLNGGSYNVLLNTTTKRMASFAASLAILSYIATGVVSGTSACTYLATQVPSIDVTYATILLLLFFAILALVGISESSIVALIMFVGHVLTLIVLCGFSIAYMIRNPSIFWDNLKTPFPDVNLAGTIVTGDAFTALFFGFAMSMLGISGFESSSQFVEEQKPGVFVKTLKNMWWGVAIFNPLISVLSLGVMPLEGPDSIASHQNTVLANMGLVVGGKFLQTWISIDAFIVLSGAVLTAYVGITGLVRRLASDRVLPDFLLHQNKLRGTNHFIIVGYFLVASSLVLVLDGNVETLSGVYTYAFLGLMILFSSGCMLLKFKRAELPRAIVAPWWSCCLAIFMVFLGFLGNLMGDPTILTYFSLYFLAVFLVVMLMFERSFILRIMLYSMQRICPSRRGNASSITKETEEVESGFPAEQVQALLRKDSATGAIGGRTIARTIQEINQNPILFFCKKPDLPTLNKAILYVRMNEQTSNLRIVHITSSPPSPNSAFDRVDGSSSRGPRNEALGNFGRIVSMFDRIYPKLKIDYMLVEGEFGPAIIEWISSTYKIPKNMMFIKQPDEQFSHKIETLGGVRVITG